MTNYGIASHRFRKEVVKPEMNNMQRKDIEFVSERLLAWLENEGISDTLTEDEIADLVLETVGWGGLTAGEDY